MLRDLAKSANDVRVTEDMLRYVEFKLEGQLGTDKERGLRYLLEDLVILYNRQKRK